MPAAAVAGTIERGPRKTGIRQDLEQLIKRTLVMKLTLLVYVEDRETGRFASSAPYEKLGMNARDRFEYF